MITRGSSMRRIGCAMLIGALMFALTACPKASEEETSGGIVESEAAQATGEETPPAPPVEEPEPSPDEVPVPEDFDDEAEASINKDNYKKEIDLLAAEIEKELEYPGQIKVMVIRETRSVDFAK